MPQKFSVLVGTTVTPVLAGKYDRKFIVVQNLSDTPVFLDFTSDSVTLTVGNGYRLDAGDTLIIDDLIGGSFTNAIEAIHAGVGTKELRIQEE
jgi:hypothetical protein